MERQICLDDDSLILNGSDLVSVQYLSTIEMASDGLAYKGAPGYLRTFTPTISFSGVAMTTGASTISGQYSVTVAKTSTGNSLYTDVTFAGQYVALVSFYVDVVLGAGFVTPAGTLELGGFPSYSSGDWNGTVSKYVGVNGTVNLIDANSTDYLYDLIRSTTNGLYNVRGETGARATNTAPFTYATTDEMHFSGWYFDFFDTDTGSL